MKYQNPNTKSDTFREEFRKRVKLFILNLIHYIDALPEDKTSRIISNQLLRSGTSIGANYFEARAASSKSDFINYFNYSLKSANESKFWLEIIIDSNKGNVKQANELLQEVSEIANIFASSILTLKGRK